MRARGDESGVDDRTGTSGERTGAIGVLRSRPARRPDRLPARAPQALPPDAEAVVTGFLARLGLELRDGDPAPVDRLTKTTVSRNAGHALGRIAAVACGVVANFWAAEHPGTPEVASYLALRSGELESRFKNERTTA